MVFFKNAGNQQVFLDAKIVPEDKTCLRSGAGVNLAHYAVDSILITDELGGTQFRKPNDLSFRVMQNRFQVPIASMVYVGDNAAKDFLAPRQLGMRWIFFRNNDGLYVKEAMSEPVEVSSVEELKLVLCDMI